MKGSGFIMFSKKRKYIIITFALFLCTGVWQAMSADEKHIESKTEPLPPEVATNRPLRQPESLLLTVGQGEGDLQGDSEKVIQAAVEYVHRMGGGTVHILPGLYNLENAICLHPYITIKGSGEKTILKKNATFVTPLVRDSDWYEYGIQVKDASGFTPGNGIMLRSKNGIDIQGPARKITISNCRFANTPNKGRQKCIRIGEKVGQVIPEDNTFTNCPVQIEDLRKKPVSKK